MMVNFIQIVALEELRKLVLSQKIFLTKFVNVKLVIMDGFSYQVYQHKAGVSCFYIYYVCYTGHISNCDAVYVDTKEYEKRMCMTLYGKMTESTMSSSLVEYDMNNVNRPSTSDDDSAVGKPSSLEVESKNLEVKDENLVVKAENSEGKDKSNETNVRTFVEIQKNNCSVKIFF